MTNNTTQEYLPRKTFFWIMGIVVFAIGSLFAFMFALSNTFNHNVTDIKVDVAIIKTDLGLLREALGK